MDKFIFILLSLILFLCLFQKSENNRENFDTAKLELPIELDKLSLIHKNQLEEKINNLSNKVLQLTDNTNNIKNNVNILRKKYNKISKYINKQFNNKEVNEVNEIDNSGNFKNIQLKKLESVLSNIDLESIKKVALEMLQNFNK